MALTDEGGNMVMPVAPMNNYGGNGLGAFGGDATWIIILFLFALMGNGFGGFGGFGGGGAMPYLFNNTNNDVQRGFDQSAIMGSLSALGSNVSNGFSNAEVAACNRAMDAMQTAYQNQINNLQSFNAMQSQLASCCCENRLATAQTQALVQSENCEDRNQAANNTRDILAATAAQTQTIMDKLNQQEINALRSENSNLQTQLNMANLAASQTAQTAQLIADNTAQTQYIVNRVSPYPQPAYIVASPYGNNCGYQNFYN